jgi:MYXO-CTERM domain-containing protein
MRVSLVVVSCLWLWPGSLLALPEDPGSLKIEEYARQESVGGKTISFDLYVPVTSKPCPIVTLAHGFARSRVMMRDWGKLLASRGYVAAAPDFPGADHPANGKLLSALLEWMVTESQKSGSPLAGRVDPTRRGVVGHSAGGLASLLAASADATIDVVVGLDPVDNGGQGKQAVPAIKVPVSVLRATPGTCNDSGNAQALYAALTGPALSLEVKAATHCDPEWPSDPFCSLLCGASDDTRRMRFVRYALATLDHVLSCAPGMAPWLGGASASSDTLIQKLESKSYPPAQLGCATAADSSPGLEGTRKDGGAAEAGRVEAGGAEAGREVGAADSRPPAEAGATVPASDDGCSCGIGEGSGSAPFAWLLLLALASATRRRRLR